MLKFRVDRRIILVIHREKKALNINLSNGPVPVFLAQGGFVKSYPDRDVLAVGILLTRSQ